MFGYFTASMFLAVVIVLLLTLYDPGFEATARLPSIMVVSDSLDDVMSPAGFGILKVGSSIFWTSCVPFGLPLGLVTGCVGSQLMTGLCAHRTDSATCNRQG